MAVQMQTAFSLPEKFERLTFNHQYENEAVETMSTPTTPTSPPIKEAYSVSKIDNGDIEDVLEFLRKFFFRDEPLNVNVKLLDGPNSTCNELEEYSIKSIKDGVSMKAVSESGQLIGVCLNGALLKNEEEECDGKCPNPKFEKILNLLDFVDREADVFAKFPDVDKIMMVKILSVDGSWRGRGIAKELMDRTRDLAKDQGYCLMRVDCTSHFSARAISKLGFECVYSLNYADYKGDDGNEIFNPEPPHTAVTVYTQRIK